MPCTRTARYPPRLQRALPFEGAAVCTCASCKITDSYTDKGFAAWPKGEMRPIPRKIKDPAYAAHWAHCGAEFYRKPAAVLGSPFPCTGTKHGDPRAWYHFPGGQVGKARSAPGGKLWPRKDGVSPATKDAQEYVAAFVKANCLT